MSCFIGLTILQVLDSSVFKQALSQIQHYLSATNYKIIPHQKILIFGSKFQKYSLVKNSEYLHSYLQHFVLSDQQDQKFVETIVECLIILKQHFPHKMQIEMVSDEEHIFNLKVKADQQIPRRLINHLKILYQKCKKTDLNQQQVHMLINNISAQFHKDYKQKLKTISLKILSQGRIDTKIWNSLTKRQIKIIDDIVNEPMYQKIGIQILQRIVRNNNYQLYPTELEKENQSPNSFTRQLLSEDQKTPEYSGPLDPMTALFQLKQSQNLSRISWIIQNTDCDKLDAKKLSKFDKRIKKVAQNFVRDLYPISCSIIQLKHFGRCIAEYQMRRVNLTWDGLIQQVLIKIQQLQKQAIKNKSRMKTERKDTKN